MNNKENFMMQDFLLQLQQINYLDILRIIGPVIVSYIVTKKVMPSYTLHRDYKPKNISKVILPPELNIEHSEIDINKIATMKYGESIVKFAETIIKNFPAKDLTNFYNNLNNLRLVSKKIGISSLILKSNVIGKYDTKKNEIMVDEAHVESSIYHELFHMASSTHKDGRKYSGFFQCSSNILLGKGLNEGYTELLTQRYFPTKDYQCGYKYQVLIAERLEKIVGEEKMQSLYLNSNLKGLIDELKQYTSEEEIMRFISDTDFLLLHMFDKKLKLFEKDMIHNCLKSINRFLIICYSKKLQQQFNDDSISANNEILIKLIEYISSLASSIETNKQSYEIMTDEDIRESLQASFENTNSFIHMNREKLSNIK